MKPAEELRQELESAERKFHRMLEDIAEAEELTGEALQNVLGTPVKRQHIVVVWLRAEYTGAILRDKREEIDENKAEELLGERSPHATGKPESDLEELGKLRAQHLDAYCLLWTFEGWQEVVKEYEYKNTR